MFDVFVTYAEDPATPVQSSFDCERRALAFIREEEKWENTITIKCDALGINDQPGDFIWVNLK